MGSVGDGTSSVCDHTERSAMHGCGSCAALWNREELAMGCERRGVDDEVDEPYTCLGHNAMWGHEMSEVAV
jgi:hypothetical protein